MIIIEADVATFSPYIKIKCVKNQMESETAKDGTKKHNIAIFECTDVRKI